MYKNKLKYLYIVLEWGDEPITFRTKNDLTFYLGKKNPRNVDDWFGNNWFSIIDNKLIMRVEIPKIKSKIRNK